MTMRFDRGAAIWLAWLTACGPKVEADDANETGSMPASDGTSDTAPEQVIIGTWAGYSDELMLRSGSDRVELRITGVAEDGSITGTIAFGEPGSIPPATDPDLGYPPGADTLTSIGWIFPYESFTYEAIGSYDATLSRLQAEVRPTELWAEWCALQIPYAWEEDYYQCLPNCGHSSGDAGCRLLSCRAEGPVDCGKLALCLNFGFNTCACEAGGCTNDPQFTIALDLHHSDNELVGSIDELGTAYLSRQ